MNFTKRLSVIVAFFILSVGGAIASTGAPSISYQEALAKLKAGNVRFISGAHLHTGDSMEVVKMLATGQKPYAIILTCSDSRLPPELLFDTGIGELFVIRVAGNVTDPIILGSIEYAAEHLGTPLVVILGHEKCGAVKATVDLQGKGEGNIGAIVQAIQPALIKTKDAGKISEKDNAQFVEAVVDTNIALVKATLINKSGVLKHLVDSDKLLIVAAKYHIDHGEVVMLD
ncbi:carbonic anhydrase [uncultured Desulfobulbus sp.]|uniref:carbonic anhydrase n=1 Tax=uncultured Desulfobulbus sp. TaxID=239745 RepID=UPI0029C6B921|nr:carbonic anhydrase [uncultured Desulfobulbus sp.]